MKKLIMMGAVAFAACAGAEEKSFWSSLLSSAEDTDAVAETAAKADSSIAKLTQQLKDLKAKMNETKKSSGDKWSELKAEYEKKYEDLKAELKAKLDPITYDPVNHAYLRLGENVGAAFKAGLSLK